VDNKLDLNALQSLIATIRIGSLSGAARKLGVPKSTVANRVNALEAKLGTRLIERTTRKIRPTAEGLLLFRRGEQLLLDADEIERSFRDRGDIPRGMLRVSVPTLFDQEFMGAIASRYIAENPNVAIEVVPDDRRVDLIGEGFDCAIRAGELDEATTIARVFAETRNIIVASPSLVERFGLPLSLIELSKWPALWVGRERPGGLAWDMEQNGQIIAVTITPRAFLGTIQAVRTALLEDAGAALVPEFYVRRDLEANRLAVISSKWPSAPISLAMVYPAHKQLSPRLRAFIDILAETFKHRELT
jgi:LysR family transcriptional regulator, regulator for bpeEF and oprC